MVAAWDTGDLLEDLVPLVGTLLVDSIELFVEDRLNDVAEVRTVELGRFIDLSRKEALTKGLNGTNPVPEFLKSVTLLLQGFSAKASVRSEERRFRIFSGS